MKRVSHPFRTLQSRVLAAVGSTFLVLFLGQWYVARSIIGQGFADLERNQAQTDAERLHQTLLKDLSDLSSTAADWARWDDTYSFVQTRDQGYVESNLTMDAFANLSLSLIAVFDRHQNLIYGRMVDPNTQTLRVIPEDVIQTLKEQPHLLDRSLESPDLMGLVRLNQPMLLASQAILTSSNEGPAMGTVVMGRQFGQTQLEELSETTRLSVESFRYEGDLWPPDVEAIAPSLGAGPASVAVQVLDLKRIAAYALIRDFSDQPATILRAITPRDLYAKGQTSLHYYFWSSLMIGAGYCLLVGLLLRRLVLSRVGQLTQQVSCISAIDDTASQRLQVHLSGQDELAQLAQTLDWTLGLLHQRTAELQTAKQVAEAAKVAADDANQAKSAFLANMSHELRTPLNAILGFAQLLGRDPSVTLKQREQISIINRSGEHLLSLINDVLDLSRIEAGHTDLQANPFDLHSLLKTLNDMLYLKAEAKGLELVIDYQDDVPQYLDGDERKLRQVLINLLNNALKFTAKGYVHLTVKYFGTSAAATDVPRGHLQFTVQDTGVGIDPEDLPTLFNPFVQAAAGHQAQQGSGLGLAISRNFIEVMGGTLTVSSQPGQGSAFSFDIWADLVEGAIALPTSVPQAVIGLEPGQPTYRILVVDDRAVNRQLLVDLLSPMGFDLREAANGEQAIEQWETWQPHLIWMDIRMPGMNGYEVTRRIKAQPQGLATTIIALTASVLDEEKALVLAAGCDDFVLKPFQQSTIFSKLATHLGVRYLYEKPEPQSLGRGAAPEPTSKLQAALAAMPEAWIEALRQAAMQLKGQELYRLSTQIPEEYRCLQQTIQQRVDNFDFDQVLALVQPGQGPSP